MNRNIVLVGFMGSGKTTVGKLIAKKLCWSFVDTDEQIVQRAQKSIEEIFAQEGEEKFRQRESEVIKEAAAHYPQVLATGGGAIMREENLRILQKTGVLFWLKLSAQEIRQRTEAQGVIRPLLDVSHPWEKICELASQREPYYTQADFTIEATEPPEDVAQRIIRLMLRSTL